MVQSIGPFSPPVCRPASFSPSSSPSAQYLPVQVAMVRGGPFAFAQEVAAALRTARRKIFNVPFYGVYLLQPSPFSLAFLSSFLQLKIFIFRHLTIVNRPLAPVSLSLSFLSSFSKLKRFILRHLYIVDQTLTLFAIFCNFRPIPADKIGRAHV